MTMHSWLAGDTEVGDSVLWKDSLWNVLGLTVEETAILLLVGLGKELKELLIPLDFEIFGRRG